MANNIENVDVMRLDATLNQNNVLRIEAALNPDNVTLVAGFNESTTTFPYYNGDYSAYPRKVEQVLETKKKVTVNDITIHAIERDEVTNLGGGTTIAIGRE